MAAIVDPVLGIFEELADSSHWRYIAMQSSTFISTDVVC